MTYIIQVNQADTSTRLTMQLHAGCTEDEAKLIMEGHAKIQHDGFALLAVKTGEGRYKEVARVRAA